MGHPLIDEFCRVSGVDACQPHFFRRCQRELRDQIQPMLDEREALIIRVAGLEAENLELKAQLMTETEDASVPVKRGPGRPRKVEDQA